jgi:hypothetical protein
MSVRAGTGYHGAVIFAAPPQGPKTTQIKRRIVMNLLCSGARRSLLPAALAAFLGTVLAGSTVFAQTTYSVRANAVNIQDTHNPPVPLVLADTGPLPSSGGTLSVSVSNVNDVGGAVLIDAATGDVTGLGPETDSNSTITNMSLQLMPPSGGPSFLSVSFVGSHANATATPGGTKLTGDVNVQGLVINGVAQVVTGKQNQVIAFPGGQVTLNAQTTNGNEITVIAMRIEEFGCMNATFGVTIAGITSTAPPPPICGKLTGGGWIVGTPSGAKGTFGVGGGVRFGDFWGHLEYIDHGTGMQVHATSVTGFTIDPNDPDCATITYNVDINHVSGFTATVIACDHGEPGRNDIFDITLSNGYHAGGDLGGASPGGGNIQMHKCPPGWLK